MKAVFAVLLGAIGALQTFAQPVCPPVNFQHLAQFRTENWPQSIVSGLVRQADQSFSQYVITGNPKAKTASVVGKVPNVQLSFFTCSGLAARNPKPGPAPNLRVDPLGTGSRNGIITDLAGDGVGAVVGPNQEYAGNQVVAVTVNADLTLRSALTYPVGQIPLGVLAGDFNGDGKHDVASVYSGPADNSTPGGISLLLGNGDGTLQPAVNYPAGLGTVAAAAWDFNGDGKDDLAVLNYADNTVTIMFGSASGKLTTGNTYSTGQSSFPGAIAVADVNGDGKPDLVISGFQGIVTLLGNGDGTFKTGPTTAAPAEGPYLATGDFNNDGKVDVAVTDFLSGMLYILVGNGDGTFTQASQYLIEYGGTSFFVEDFDGDGNPDIVFASGHPDALFTLPQTQEVAVLFGNGDGTFAGTPAYNLPGYPSGMVSADFNGDGKPDLAIAGGQAGPVSILLGTGGGTFQASAALTGASSVYSGLAAGDLNGDGKMDLVVNDIVFLGNGNGTFQAGQTVPGSSSDTSFAAIGDFNNNNHLGLAMANLMESSVTIVPGNGDGTFGAGVTVPVGNDPSFIVTGDFNKDGNLDLAVVNSGFLFMTNIPGSLSILLGKGDGTFQDAVNYTLSTTIWPGSIVAGDFNNDGITDLALVTFTGNDEVNGTDVVVFIGNGDGTFKPGVLYPTEFGGDTIQAADFNGDGKLDLIVGHCCGDSNVTYLLGNGDGTFQPEAAIAIGGGFLSSAVADFNGDGKLDIAFGGQTNDTGSYGVFIFLNTSAAFSKQTPTIVSAANPAAVAIAPGSLATAYGTDLANKNAGGTSLPLPTSFGGTSISILDSSGSPSSAPLLYVSPTQVNFEVPLGIATGAAAVTVSSGDGTETLAIVQIAPVAPGLFELNSAGLAAAYVILYHADGTQTVEQVYKVSGGDVVATPVSLGSSTDKPYLFLFGTGFEAAGTAGVTVSVGGTNVPVSFAGSQGGFAGLDQANVELPASLAGKGKVTIQLTANGLAADAVNITIQ
jgi:uncharacterized protein (TIGR03437 family)